MLLLVVLRHVSSSKACVWLIIKSEFKEMDYTSPFRVTVSTKQPRYLCYRCCGSVANLYPVLSNAMDYSTPGLPVLHYLPEFSQTHVHWTGGAIQSSHPLLPTSPPALNQITLPSKTDFQNRNVCFSVFFFFHFFLIYISYVLFALDGLAEFWSISCWHCNSIQSSYFVNSRTQMKEWWWR